MRVRGRVPTSKLSWRSQGEGRGRQREAAASAQIPSHQEASQSCCWAPREEGNANVSAALSETQMSLSLREGSRALKRKLCFRMKTLAFLLSRSPLAWQLAGDLGGLFLGSGQGQPGQESSLSAFNNSASGAGISRPLFRSKVSSPSARPPAQHLAYSAPDYRSMGTCLASPARWYIF